MHQRKRHGQQAKAVSDEKINIDIRFVKMTPERNCHFGRTMEPYLVVFLIGEVLGNPAKYQLVQTKDDEGVKNARQKIKTSPFGVENSTGVTETGREAEVEVWRTIRFYDTLKRYKKIAHFIPFTPILQ